ncbi:hypothetical protein LCGC14_1454460 [marine sediment metagenome]|uniref:Uncharacterized protein n=1 Tax=marine sediment metagenome TaxID=412755 RepID=A0A0F9LXF9_9ZZZZ
MAANIGDVFSGAVPSGSVVGLIMLLFVVGMVVLVFIGGLGFFIWNKRRWNLKVEIKLPRSDGKLIQGEWAKGFYDAKKGVVLIKRKGVKAVAMQVFDVKKYLQGSDLLTVIQLAPEDYRPVLNESWTEYKIEKIDKKTGEVVRDADGKIVYEKLSIIDIKVDSGLNKAWKSSWDAAAKKAYSLQSFFAQFQTPIAIGIVIISTFVGFAIIWTRLGSVCGG